MIDLHFSANATSQTREITHAGRAYLVAPVVALKEGILNGVLVTAAEFGKYAASWAGRPVPLGHPQANGQYISANSPDVWESLVPGHLWNVAADGDKLKGEIWIDLDKAQRLGEKAMQIVHRLRAGQPVEVSTGYFADTEETPGLWNGVAYSGIARHIRPDHLALLPDEVGACSWADGCGTPRVNTGGAVEEQPEVQTEQEQGLFERFLGWLRGHHAVELSIHQEKEGMNKTDLLAALTANQQCKFSKEKLETWQESDLQTLAASLTAHDDPPKPPEPVPPNPPPPPPEPPKPPPAEATALEARLARIEELLQGVTAHADQERNDLIGEIVANAAATWSADDLRTFSIDQLRKLHAMALPRDYSANGGSYRAGRGAEEEELLMPWPQREN